MSLFGAVTIRFNIVLIELESESLESDSAV